MKPEDRQAFGRMTEEIRKAKLHLWKLLRAIPADHQQQNADLYESLKTDKVIRQLTELVEDE